jgi:hypothetical protein
VTITNSEGGGKSFVSTLHRLSTWNRSFFFFLYLLELSHLQWQ